MTPEVDASLAALQAKGVLGAGESRRVSKSVRDAARVVCTVNPPRKSSVLDAVLRAVHQPGLRRRGDAELLLEVHGSDGRSLAARARKRYLRTLRGALTIDLVTNPAHSYLLASGAALVVLSVAAIACRVLRDQSFVARAARPVAWVGVKVAVLAVFLSVLWSARSLARAAMGLTTKSSAERSADRYGRPAAAAALAVGGAYLGRDKPLLFVVGCAAAVYVLSASRSGT